MRFRRSMLLRVGSSQLTVVEPGCSWTVERDGLPSLRSGADDGRLMTFDFVDGVGVREAHRLKLVLPKTKTAASWLPLCGIFPSYKNTPTGLEFKGQVGSVCLVSYP